MSKKIDIIKHELFAIIGNCGDELNMSTFVIGGWVRDSILKHKKNEIEFDIVSDGDGILLAKKVAKRLKLNKISIFKTFGTASLNYKDIKLEFNGARKESYHHSSRNPKVEKGSIKDDQKRRDFTINAMAISLNKKNYGEFFDPFNGLKDLKQKLIRTPLEPTKTYSDDPLRMMRAIRFATTLEFKIESSSFNAIKENKNRLSIIKQERITEELNKIILSNKPSTGFDLLSKTGLLKIFFPELDLLHGTETINGMTHKDNFYHTLKVLDNVSQKSSSLWLRWSALLHDIAKPNTKRFNKKTGWTFHGHEHLGSKMVYHIFKRLKLPLNEHMKYVQKLVLLHLRPIALSKENVTDSGIRRLLFDAKNDIDDLMLLCNADITSKNDYKVKKYKKNLEIVSKKLVDLEKRDNIRNWQPPINGSVIMKQLKLQGGKSNPDDGKKIAVIKEKIKDAILDGKIKNEFKEAEELMYQIAKELGINY
ncbi:MAG: tRNA nucleotidyltransferase [Flavobacteriales bacterium]|nr:tRNA nucleotidyltransferase [Flavobacteriales bacterium]